MVHPERLGHAVMVGNEVLAGFVCVCVCVGVCVCVCVCVKSSSLGRVFL